MAMPKRFLVTGLLVLLLVGFATFIASPRASAEAISNTTISTFSFVGQEVFSCNGSAFLITDGTIQVVSHTTLLPNGDFSAHNEVTWQGVKAIDEATNASYEEVGTNGSGVKGSVDNFFSNQGATTETIATNTQLVGQGTAPNIGFNEIIHLTYNADGTLTAEFDHLRMDC
ncbi:MAG TPA: hypothetical protein VFU69_14920 [Ktedonobacterales bacterium]|nr:hypothetical protein [Ktedonobacterales bacterium]